jgi:hypothetical protein
LIGGWVGPRAVLDAVVKRKGNKKRRKEGNRKRKENEGKIEKESEKRK